MKKQIAIIFALVAGAMLTLAGCVSMPEGGTQDDSAMMLNYPYVNLSLTEDQTTMNYPWGNTGLDNEATDDSAMVSNGLEMYPYVFVAAQSNQ